MTRKKKLRKRQWHRWVRKQDDVKRRWNKFWNEDPQLRKNEKLEPIKIYRRPPCYENENFVPYDVLEFDCDAPKGPKECEKCVPWILIRFCEHWPCVRAMKVVCRYHPIVYDPRTGKKYKSKLVMKRYLKGYYREQKMYR